MPEEEDGLALRSTWEIHLKLIPELFCLMDSDLAAQFSKAGRQYGANAVHRGFDVAWRLQRNQLFDGVENGGLLLLEMTKLGVGGGRSHS